MYTTGTSRRSMSKWTAQKAAAAAAAIVATFAASSCALGLASSASRPTSTTTGARDSSSSNTARTMSTTAAAGSMCSTLEVAQFPCLDDNYGYLIHDATTGETAAIDTPCADTIRRELDRHGWTLTHVLNTHQ
mmetsp:Transcript_4029/g.7919  ORF Transcript_4029/g.7919 Transcript_4029/m.7919 type:complete len:133 (-) Transcript_4029:260-658(-)